MCIIKFIKRYIIGRRKLKERLKYIYVTSNGAFGLKSSYFTDNKEEVLNTIKKLRAALAKRNQHEKY